MEKHKSSTASEAARRGQKPESPGPEPGRVHLQKTHLFPVEERLETLN